ncbi:MAG: DNA repair protein RecN [Sphingomonadales bacterium]
MLLRLCIQNYAIIDEIEISFSPHFSVITGETGAGKSILMGALGLILGERADASALGNKEKKLIVEGQFDIRQKKAVLDWLGREELDQEDALIIRREIAAAGKSRAFVNDTPVTLSQLQQLSSLLVDLHQQFDTLDLEESSFQREVLDALAGQLSLLDQYHQQYRILQQQRQRVTMLSEQKRKLETQADYDRFQLEELDAAAFVPGEIESAAVELKSLSHADSVQATLTHLSMSLLSGDEALLPAFKLLLNELASQKEFHAELPALEERLRSSYVEMQDVARDLERLSQKVQVQPERMAHLNERLSVGYRLCKKHQVSTTDELLAFQQALRDKCQVAIDIDQELLGAQKAQQESEQKALQLATQLSTGRKKQVAPFEKKVNALLKQVGMPAAQLQVQLKSAALGADGIDEVIFLFDANRSGQFQSLRKVASGGELSRLMLCIKSLVAASLDLPTLIFDEIDTGISGEAARQVGLLLQELATNRQVICITHQPQIAGKAQSHFFVYKQLNQEAREAAITRIKLLDEAERIDVMARMLGGDQPSAAARANAREMLS